MYGNRREEFDIEDLRVNRGVIFVLFFVSIYPIKLSQMDDTYTILA